MEQPESDACVACHTLGRRFPDGFVPLDTTDPRAWRPDTSAHGALVEHERGHGGPEGLSLLYRCRLCGSWWEGTVWNHLDGVDQGAILRKRGKEREPPREPGTAPDAAG